MRCPSINRPLWMSSIIAIGGLCLYQCVRRIYMARKPSRTTYIDSTLPADTRHSNVANNSTQYTIEHISLAKKFLAIIIGYSGNRKSTVETKFSIKITVKNPDVKSHCCLLKVHGRPEDIFDFRQHIHREIERFGNRDEELILPTVVANKVDTFDLHLRTLADVKIELQPECASQSKITITGKDIQLNFAKKKLYEEVKANISLISAGQEFKYIKPLPKDAAIELQKSFVRLQPLTQYDISLPKAAMLEKLKSRNECEGQMEVNVTAIADISKFWIQIKSWQLRRYDVLVTEMSEYYGNPVNSCRHFPERLYLGQIIATNLGLGEKWYRAEIINIEYNVDSSGIARVDAFFVDHGFNEYVEPKDIFEIRTEFLALRNQAVQCSLAGVKPSEETWSEQAIHDFNELCKEDSLVAQIVSYSCDNDREIPQISLYSQKNPKNNFAHSLVVKGQARPIKLTDQWHEEVEPLVSQSNSWSDSDEETLGNDPQRQSDDDHLMENYTKEVLLSYITRAANTTNIETEEERLKNNSLLKSPNDY